MAPFIVSVFKCVSELYETLRCHILHLYPQNNALLFYLWGNLEVWTFISEGQWNPYISKITIRISSWLAETVGYQMTYFRNLNGFDGLRLYAGEFHEG